jgi:agmatinase
MMERVRTAVRGYAQLDKVVGLLGGEHSITIGAVQAHQESHADLSVVYLDAHADLRHEYMDTSWGHASGARRIHETCPLVLVGVRSLCQEERDYIRSHALPTFFWPPDGGKSSYVSDVVNLLSPSVYVSVDLDVFDPSIMSAVGTPEPGGMNWYEVAGLLRAVAESRKIIGFDVSELSPREGPTACAYTAAKLVYKLVAYATTLSGGTSGRRR